MNERRGIGALAWTVAGLALLHLVGLVVLRFDAAAAFRAIAQHPPLGAVLRSAMPITDLLLAVVFGISARRAWRLRPGVDGKLRAICMGVVGAVHFPVMAATSAALLTALIELGRARLTSFISPLDLLYVIDPEHSNALKILGAISLTTAAPLAVLLVAHWFVLPKRWRERFFFVFDSIVGVAFVFAIAKLPISPIDDVPNSLIFATVRHVVTALFAIRLFVRILPYGLDVFERANVHAFIAARHLRSRRSKFLSAISFLSVLAVSASSCLLSVVLSVMGGFRTDLERKILGNSAHVVVDRENGTFEGWETTLQRVRATNGVVAASPYVQAEVMITSASNFSGALLRGIDPASAASVNALERNLASDRRRTRGSLALLVDPSKIDALSTRERCPGSSRSVFLSPDEEEPETHHESDAEPRAGILIGSELARSLRLCVGDDLDVISPLGELGPAGPMPSTRRFRVAGIFYSGMYEYDMKQVYVLLPIAQGFLRTGGALSGIDVRVAGVDASASAARAIRRGIGRNDLRVQDWRQRNRSLFGALALEKLVIFVTLGITVLIAGFCVFATLTLMVQEKRQDVGILKAMGATDRSIVSVFLSEGLLIGIIGAVSGIGFGWLAAFAAEHFGIALNPEVYYIDRLPVQVDLGELATVGASAALVCVLSTIGPAIFASRLRPVDAVRAE